MYEELQERLTELEIKFSHQALQVEELNEVIIDCHKRIDHLVKDNHRLAKMLETLAETLEESPDE
jgi:SlyX protein